MKWKTCSTRASSASSSGGRIGYVLFYNLPVFLADPLYLFRVWDGGMSFHGGLIGVILGDDYLRQTHQTHLLPRSPILSRR